MRSRSSVPAASVVVSIIPLTAVAFLGETMDPAQLPKWWLAVAAAATGGALVVGTASGSGKLSFPSKWFSSAAVMFGLALVFSVAVSHEQVRAVMGGYGRWNGAGGYSAYLMLGVLAAMTVNTPERRRRVTSAILLSAGIVSGYALLQRAGLDPLPWNNIYAPSSTSFLGNPNFAAAYIGIPTPLVAARYLSASGRSRLGYGALFFLLVGGQAAAGSLLGPFATGIGLAVMAVVMLATSDRPRARRTGGILAWVGPVAGLAALYAFWSGTVVGPLTVTIRLYYWRAALGMFSDHPLVGVGLGRFEDFFRRYRPAGGFAEFGNAALADNPHSVPLALASEGGLLLLLPWLVLLGAIVGLVVSWARSARRREVSNSDRLAVAAWSGAFAAYVGQSLANFDVPSLAVLGFILGGSVVALTGETVELSMPGTRPVRRGVAMLAGVLAFVAAAAATVPVSADRAAGMGLRHEAAGDYDAAVRSFDAASRRAWWEPDYGFAAGLAAYEGGDVPGAQQRFEATAASFEQSLEPAWASGRVAVELGQWDRAADWYRRVLILDPNDQELVAEATEVIQSARDAS